ncbi:MAG: hypothetical protein FWC52_00940 [Candidatus Methanoplasma sp.]|nr:hypothetical protein [Candidatus Methanoplasma sp.]
MLEIKEEKYRIRHDDHIVAAYTATPDSSWYPDFREEMKRYLRRLDVNKTEYVVMIYGDTFHDSDKDPKEIMLELAADAGLAKNGVSLEVMSRIRAYDVLEGSDYSQFYYFGIKTAPNILTPGEIEYECGLVIHDPITGNYGMDIHVPTNEYEQSSVLSYAESVKTEYTETRLLYGDCRCMQIRLLPKECERRRVSVYAITPQYDAILSTKDSKWKIAKRYRNLAEKFLDAQKYQIAANLLVFSDHFEKTENSEILGRIIKQRTGNKIDHKRISIDAAKAFLITEGVDTVVREYISSLYLDDPSKDVFCLGLLHRQNKDFNGVHNYSLPFPYVQYGGEYFAFSKDSSSNFYLCECQKRSIENRIKIFMDHYQYDTALSPRDELLLKHMGMPQYFANKIKWSGLPLGEAWLYSFRYKEGICHLCNKVKPDFKYSVYVHDSDLRKEWGHYLKSRTFHYGIDDTEHWGVYFAEEALSPEHRKLLCPTKEELIEEIGGGEKEIEKIFSLQKDEFETLVYYRTKSKVLRERGFKTYSDLAASLGIDDVVLGNVQKAIHKRFLAVCGTVRNEVKKSISEAGKAHLGEKSKNEKTVKKRSKTPKPGEYIYLSVSFEKNGKTYYYRTTDTGINVGDVVVVPVSSNTEGIRATVEAVERFKEADVPLEPDLTKEIIRRGD